MLVQRKFSLSEKVYSVSDTYINRQRTNLRMTADLLEMKLFTRKDKGRFSIGDVGLDIRDNELVKEADILHLHWINEGFLSIRSIRKLNKLNKPIVWTFHDMWGFTGGCHYSGECRRYQAVCGSCPYLKHSSEHDLSNKFHLNKSGIFRNIDLTIITCSKWLSEITLQSSIFANGDVTPVPNTLKVDIYKPMDQQACRQKLKLPQDKFLLLFGTLNTKEERKGFSYLRRSLQHLSGVRPSLREKIELIVFGTSSPEELQDFPFKINSLGRIGDDNKLAVCYNAADLFLAPSLEDNLPNTVMESLACGVPVAAFNIGGIPEMVDHKLNGYLAKEKSVEDLAEGILYFYEHPDEMPAVKENARKKVVDCFSPEIIAAKHIQIYHKALEKKI